MKKIALASALLLAGLAIGFLLGRLRFAWPSRSDLPPVSRPVPGPPLEVTLTATIDGSDRFVFAGESLWNEHLAWQAPRNVRLNGQPWTDLTVAPPGWADQARDLDLTKATIVERKGRDLIALETTADGFALILSDTPMGSGAYEVTVRIPRK
jgi:hypothetical protein